LALETRQLGVLKEVKLVDGLGHVLHVVDVQGLAVVDLGNSLGGHG
jgi:hypothetical protein